MAKVTIAHLPELSARDVESIFSRQFAPKYQIVSSPRRGSWDFIIKKSEFVGVGVRLKQRPKETSLHFGGEIPDFSVGCLVMVSVILFLGPGLVVALIYRFVIMRGITDEVRAFMETAEEFKFGTSPIESTSSPKQSGGTPGEPGVLVCPNCSRRYVSGRTSCLDCGMPLAPP